MDIIGTSGDDTLYGSSKNDLIKGLGGDDWLDGQGGTDTLLGGSGADTLVGGSGADVLNGGTGDDSLQYGSSGNDTVIGGAGDDTLIGDLHATASRTVILDGGAGNDHIYLNDENHLSDFVVTGGQGDDEIQAQDAQSAIIDAGAGDDYVRTQHGHYTVTLGDGHDHLELFQGNDLTVTDFQAVGASADALVLSNYLAFSLPGWDQHSNPFAGGFVRFIQDGADAVLQLDAAGGGSSWTDAVRFDGLDAASLTQANLSGYDPDNGSIHAVRLTGSDLGETLFGSAGDDVIRGGGGADQIYGQLGDDKLNGGAGDDLLTDNSGGDDTMSGGAGDDQVVITRGGNDHFAESISLSGGAGADALLYFSFNEPVSTVFASGGAGDDTISVDTALSATLVGGAGADVMDAAGTTSATFVYQAISDSTVSQADVIRDFSNTSVIDLSRIDADTTQDGDQVFRLVSRFDGHAGELVVTFDSAAGMTLVEGDVDGDGVADLEIDLMGAHKGFTNFVL